MDEKFIPQPDSEPTEGLLDELQDRHPFPMSFDEAGSRNMTHSDLIRYWYTGDLPDHVLRGMEATFREQTRTASTLPYMSATTPTPERMAHVEELEDVPYFDSYSAFQQWGLPKIRSISSQITLAMEAPETSTPSATLARSAQWDETYLVVKARWWDDAANDGYITEAIMAQHELVPALLESDSLTSAAKADLIDTATLTLPGYLFTERRLVAAFKANLEGGDVELYADFLSRTTSVGHLTTQALESMLMYPNQPEVAFETAVSMLTPLAQRIHLKSQDGLMRADNEFELVRNILQDVDNLEDAALHTIVSRVDFNYIADTIFGACAARTEALSRGTDSVTHDVATNILTTLVKLYLPSNREKLSLPVGLSAFLTPVYLRKLADYEGYSDLLDLRNAFNRLARACDSPHHAS